MKPLTLIAIALTLFPSAARSDTCPSLERTTTAPPVYVVLYGYPHIPDKPQATLTQVDEDLLLMADFFDALQPRRIWIHGEPEPALIDRVTPEPLRAPSWRALRTTIAELQATLPATEPRPRIYLYFSGHGQRTQRDGEPSTHVFGQPEPGATERGYNGHIDGGLLADEILAPLSERADVHLLVDTCMSFFLLSARAPTHQINRVRKAPPAFHLEQPFARRLPHVGASLAAHYATYEARDLNGLFSHALRSAAIGIGDLNADGILTYGELHYTLRWLLRETPGGAEPTIVPPSLEPETTFIDWRNSPAARVCLPPTLTGTHVVATPHGRSASLPLHPQHPSPLWLHDGRSYQLISQHHDHAFIARNGALTLDPQHTATSRGSAFEPLFHRPVEVTDTYPLPVIPDFDPQWYYGIGLSGGIGEILDPNLGDNLALTALALLHARIGRGRHRLDLEAGWSSIATRLAIPARRGESEHRSRAHTLLARAGYDAVLIARDWELSLAAHAGAAQRIDGDFLPEGALRATGYFPLPFAPMLSGRVDARAVVMPVGSSLDTLIQLGVGIDFERPIE